MLTYITSRNNFSLCYSHLNLLWDVKWTKYLSLTSQSSLNSLFFQTFILKSAASMRDWFGSCLRFFFACIQKMKCSFGFLPNILSSQSTICFVTNDVRISVIPWNYCVSIDLLFEKWYWTLLNSCKRKTLFNLDRKPIYLSLQSLAQQKCKSFFPTATKKSKNNELSKVPKKLWGNSYALVIW